MLAELPPIVLATRANNFIVARENNRPRACPGRLPFFIYDDAGGVHAPFGLPLCLCSGFCCLMPFVHPEKQRDLYSLNAP